MKKINRDHFNEMWEMRHLTVKEFFSNLSKHPDLKFLLTSAGIWQLIRFALNLILLGNIIYCTVRIFILSLA
jgi:hypothetical protein